MKSAAFRRLVLLTLCAALLPRSAAAQRADRGGDPLTPDLLRPHLRFLAADELEGRETGRRGQRIAALYIASVFERLGLRPAGDTGTYFQRFPLYLRKPDEARIASGTCAFSTSGTDLIAVIGSSDTLRATVAFCGYGIDDRRTGGYSDYDSVNARGRIVVVLAGDPAAERSRWSNTAFDTPPLAKYRAASDAGAVALLVVNDLDGRSIADQRRIAGRMADRGPLALRHPPPERPRMPEYLVSTALADSLLRETGRSVAELRAERLRAAGPLAVSTRGEATIAQRSVTDTLWTENVAGILPGRDPALRGEAVVFSAHYDHLGIRHTGELYNGADDDGSGTSTVLGLAEAFARAKRPPRRSLLFLLFTGEEKGLLGSEWYAEHPIVPLDRTDCDLNLDMVGRTDPHYDSLGNHRAVYVIGSDRISAELDDAVRRAAARSGLILDYTYDDEHDPHQYYRRSDHYNFARNGVPVAFFFDGEHADYHKPTDDFEKIEFDKMARIGSMVYRIAADVAERRAMLARTAKRPATR